MKPFAQHCLEYAEKASPGPWIKKEEIRDIGFIQEILITFKSDDQDQDKFDAEFIAFSREGLPELARRLQKACEALRHYDAFYKNPTCRDLADELERMPE